MCGLLLLTMQSLPVTSEPSNVMTEGIISKYPAAAAAAVAAPSHPRTSTVPFYQKITSNYSLSWNKLSTDFVKMFSTHTTNQNEKMKLISNHKSLISCKSDLFIRHQRTGLTTLRHMLKPLTLHIHGCFLGLV